MWFWKRVMTLEWNKKEEESRGRAVLRKQTHLSGGCVGSCPISQESLVSGGVPTKRRDRVLNPDARVSAVSR